MGNIHYVIGDATNPLGDGNKIIAHVCNDCNAWGKGFVLAINKAFGNRPMEEFRRASESLRISSNSLLGTIQIVKVCKGIYVCNMIAQHGINGGGMQYTIPLRYDALGECLKQLADKAIELKASVHMPRIGCGLAGGSWDKVEEKIRTYLLDKGVSVIVYDLP